MSIEKLNEKSKKYTATGFDGYKDEGRLSFISKFPIETLKDLTVDQYVQGTDKNSFCYWLEFKKIVFGIGGGNASKFGLYKTKDGNYYNSCGKNKQELSDGELAEHFDKIKSGIVAALKFTDRDEIEKIKNIDIPIWNMVLQKILSIYYPSKFLTIGSPEVLIECARDIKIKDIELSNENSIQINYECKKALSALPEYKDWPYEKMAAFIWETYLDDSKRNYYIIGSKYGAHEDVFPKMFDKSVIATGHAFELNLEEYYYKNYSEITEYLKEQGKDNNSCNALKHFLTLKVGDRVAIKADGSPKGSRGFLSIVGIAEVTEKDGEIYRYDPDGLGHLINVRFIKAPVYKEFELGGYGSTIHKLSKPDHINLIFKSDYEMISIEDLNKIPKEARVIYAYLKKSLSHRKIQKEILGTEAPSRGGGFLAMEILHRYEIEGDKKGILNSTPFHKEFFNSSGKYRESLEMLNKYYPEFSITDNNKTHMNFPLNTILYGPPGTGKTYNTILRAAEIIENRKIDSYKEALTIFKKHLNNRIEFITFHQNYSYEDFIQGLRPDTENEKELTFERKDGVFKVIADKALKNILESEQPKVIKKPFEEVLSQFITPLIEGEIDEIEVKMKKVSYFITAIRNKSIDFRKTIGRSIHTLSISTLKKMYEAESVFDIQGLVSYYSPLLDEFLRIGKDSKGRKEEVTRKNYVIVIDEINRANISRVFGELITLIEPDKRSHGTIPMETRLPSGDTFIVPSNLYIIGTMNTADKSIALLDIALRRRFEFEPMYSKYEIEDNEIYDVDILKKINKKIIESKGHDFQIGHAYFMGENKDLVQRMNKKVIPLLLEYYMNDGEEVKKILCSAGLQIEEDSWPLRITGKND